MSTITDIGDALRAEPMPLADFPQAWIDALIEALRPDPIRGFSEQQSAWIYAWYLEVTPDKLAELQALHPRQYAARKGTDGKLYLSAALLTDAVNGRSLSAALPILANLKLRHDTAVTFPKPATDEII